MSSPASTQLGRGMTDLSDVGLMGSSNIIDQICKKQREMEDREAELKRKTEAFEEDMRSKTEKQKAQQAELDDRTAQLEADKVAFGASRERAAVAGRGGARPRRVAPPLAGGGSGGDGAP